MDWLRKLEDVIEVVETNLDEDMGEALDLVTLGSDLESIRQLHDALGRAHFWAGRLVLLQEKKERMQQAK